jgi:uncharacterized membrane protein (DUF4010 family)
LTPEAGATLAGAPGVAIGLGAALGGGLLIGLERERRKGRGEQRGAAGIRSFTLAALGGGIAQALQQPALVALGALLVAALVAVAYWKSRERLPGEPPPDPGLTSELALFITYLVGVLSVQAPPLGAGAAALVAMLLAAREKLHRLATELLSEAELHDALLLAALALVLLPVLPSQGLPWLGDVAPRTLLLTVLLILGLQAAGHVALRLAGARAGLVLAGLLSGFVSSTATIASMGARARAEPAVARACLGGALASTVATWLQGLLLLATLAPAVLPRLLPAALAGTAVAAAATAWAWRGAGAGVPAPAAPGAHEPRQHGPLRLREAMAVAAMLAAVTAGVAWAQGWLGSGGVFAGTALAALADAHAPVAAMATLHGSGRVDADAVVQATVLAVAVNSLSRAAVAWAAGGRRWAVAVATGLAAAAAAAGGVLALA